MYQHADTKRLIEAALAEDLAQAGDVTVRALVPDEASLGAVVTAKEDGVVCGLPVFSEVFEAVRPGAVNVSFCADDGTSVQAGEEVLRCHGQAAAILIAERTALNIAQRLSGVATVANRYAQAVAGTSARVFDTRKTTPGFRVLEKHAVVAGGASNHRIGLFDQVLIKENHIALMGDAGSGPAEAVARCRAQLGADAVIEVEIESLEDLEAVIEAGASIVMVDNLPPEQHAEAVRIRGGRAVQLEASGGITLETIRAYAETGIDRISIGALTHSVKAMDLSLRCEVA